MATSQADGIIDIIKRAAEHAARYAAEHPSRYDDIDLRCRVFSSYLCGAIGVDHPQLKAIIDHKVFGASNEQ